MDELHQLKIFYTAAQRLSFTRAAQELFLTQSAVSHQISALERRLGAELFARQGRQVELTDPGRVLLAQMPRIFAALEEAELAVKQASQPDLGRIRIGASSTACQYLIPESLREFRESYPQYTLAISVGDSPQVQQQILDGTLDLGIMIRADRNRQLAYYELFEDELGFIVSPLHPWARAEKPDRREMANQHYVMYTRTSATFRLVERHFLKLQIPLKDYTELQSMEAIKELVKLGLGISVMAPWIAAAELSSKSLVWLRIPGTKKLRRTWCIATRAGRRLNLAEQTFLGLCRATADNLTMRERGE